MNGKDLSDFAVKNWKPFAALLGGAIVALAGYGIWNDHKSKLEQEATNALYEAQLNARAAVVAKHLDDAEKFYQPVFEKYPRSRAAYEAELQMGDFWMDSGGYDKALAHYSKALDAALDPFSRLLALHALGVGNESAGKFQEAINDYEEALKMNGSDFLKPEILMAEARCFESLKNAAKAIELYKIVEDKFSNRSYYSGAASAYEKRLAAKQI